MACDPLSPIGMRGSWSRTQPATWIAPGKKKEAADKPTMAGSNSSSTDLEFFSDGGQC